ncbi:MAG: hypothetical protein KC442_11660 [Thermomicrobiales bacterium]|nr:hypothetical protein [Thermomicrobiales bacterium]
MAAARVAVSQPQPRAVVDDDDLVFLGKPNASYAAQARVLSRERGKPIANALPEPQPRALVALSEDRQWLVVQHPRLTIWEILERDEDYGHVAYFDGKNRFIEDTGQDANEVLREWLAERPE